MTKLLIVIQTRKDSRDGEVHDIRYGEAGGPVWATCTTKQQVFDELMHFAKGESIEIKWEDVRGLKPVWQVVMNVMKATDTQRLSNQQWREVYTLADGMGKNLSLEQCQEMCFDWSHVRDSSLKAFDAMYAKLTTFLSEDQMRRI